MFKSKKMMAFLMRLTLVFKIELGLKIWANSNLLSEIHKFVPSQEIFLKCFEI